LKFNENFTHLYKENNGLVINLSAIAKGWAVDEIALMLDNLGYENYLIEIGGELKAKGVKNEANDSWVVGINIPKPYKSENILAVSLNDLAVATSGNYRNFYIKNEKVRSHTISFKTGYPVETDVASVSVFHKSCMMADAYATAIVSMGIAEGIKFADKYDLMVLIYDNNLKMHLSSTAKQILQGDVL
jgi:thiamine biosynthesis lipoprotein